AARVPGRGRQPGRWRRRAGDRARPGDRRLRVLDRTAAGVVARRDARVFSPGLRLALPAVASAARFGRSAAEQTGYVPRSVVAVPLLDDEGSVGVLEVLDKRSEAAFDLRD